MIRLTIVFMSIILIFGHGASPMRRAASRLLPNQPVKNTPKSQSFGGTLFKEGAGKILASTARERGIAQAHAELIEEPSYIVLHNIDLVEQIQDIQNKNSKLIKHVDAIKNEVDTLFEQQQCGTATTLSTDFFSTASLRAQEYTPLLSHIQRKGIQNPVWRAASRCAQEITLAKLKNKQLDLRLAYIGERTFNERLLQDYSALRAKREAYLLHIRNNKLRLELQKKKPANNSLFTYFSSLLSSFTWKKQKN